MNVFEAEFSTGQVIKAAGITNPVLQNWIHRGVIVGHRGEGVDMPGQAGRRRVFTYFNVVEIATAAALVQAGLALKDSFAAAAGFAHVGSAHLEPGGHVERLPGLPFRDQRTVLCVAGDRSEALKWTPGEDLYAMARHRLGRPAAMLMLDVSDLVDRVLTALGYHPEDVFQSAYASNQE